MPTTGVRNLQSGVADLFRTLAGGGSSPAAMRAEQSELDLLADLAVQSARRRKLGEETRKIAEETQGLRDQNMAFRNLGGAVEGMLPALELDPAQGGNFTTLLRAGRGNAQQLTGGFENLANLFRQQAGIESFSTQPERAAALFAASGRTPPARFTTSKGVTTNRFTGGTTLNPDAAAADPELTASLFNSITQSVARDEKGNPLSDPVTGRPFVVPDVDLRRGFLMWANANGRRFDLQSFADYLAEQGLAAPDALEPPPAAVEEGGSGASLTDAARVVGNAFQRLFGGGQALARPAPALPPSLPARSDVPVPRPRPGAPGADLNVQITGGAGDEQTAIIQEAAQALNEGAPPELVAQRLRELGINIEGFTDQF